MSKFEYTPNIILLSRSSALGDLIGEGIPRPWRIFVFPQDVRRANGERQNDYIPPQALQGPCSLVIVEESFVDELNDEQAADLSVAHAQGYIGETVLLTTGRCSTDTAYWASLRLRPSAFLKRLPLILKRAVTRMMRESRGWLADNLASVVPGMPSIAHMIYPCRSVTYPIPTGLKFVDKLIGGLHQSEFIVIGGLTATSKSRLVFKIGEGIAVRRNLPVLMFMPGLRKEYIAKRILELHSHTGVLESEWMGMLQAHNDLYQAPLYIFDASAYTVEDVRRVSRRMAGKVGLKLIIVDAIQSLWPRSRSQSYAGRMSDISKTLRDLARNLKTPVVVTVKTSVPDMRGEPAICRLSRSLRRYADTILLLHRIIHPQDILVPEKSPPPPHRLEMLLAKRQGKEVTGSAPYLFYPSTMTFRYERRCPKVKGVTHSKYQR